MASNNNTIKTDQSRLDFFCRSFGRYSGEPTVSVKLSKDKKINNEVGSIVSIMENYNWVNPIESGDARLYIYGNEPVDSIHQQGIDGLTNSLSPRFVDFGVNDLQQEPPRYLKRIADYYTVFVPDSFDFDRDVMQWYARQSRNFNNIDFVFGLDTTNGDEYVNEISKEYKLYNSDIYIQPKGRKFSTAAKRAGYCEKMCKKHGWNMNGRIDLLTNYEEDEG